MATGATANRAKISTKDYERNFKLFMQNKANFKMGKMNINIYATKHYGDISKWTLNKNKANLPAKGWSIWVEELMST